jgi:hypothetical protein
MSWRIITEQIRSRSHSSQNTGTGTTSSSRRDSRPLRTRPFRSHGHRNLIVGLNHSNHTNLPIPCSSHMGFPFRRSNMGCSSVSYSSERETQIARYVPRNHPSSMDSFQFLASCNIVVSGNAGDVKGYFDRIARQVEAVASHLTQKHTDRPVATYSFSTFARSWSNIISLQQRNS